MMQTNSLWTEVRDSIKNQLPDHSGNIRLAPVFNDSLEENMIDSCANGFSQKRVNDLFSNLIKTELGWISKGQVSALSLEISTNHPNRPCKKTDQDNQLLLPKLKNRPRSGRFLRRDFTFDHFVVGNNNDFAYSAALSFASHTFSNQNSLFLISKTGMGKSHLAQAVGNHILSSYPQDRIYYVAAEDFANELIQNIRNDNVDLFNEKYCTHCDVLILEDVHKLTGQDQVHIELALTIETFLDAGKKIIFTSSLAPSEIPGLNEKLKSRLSSSLMARIEPPSYNIRLKILKQKCKDNGYSLPEEILIYIAVTLVKNVRQLESGVNALATKAVLLGVPVSMELAESVIKNII